MSLRLSLVLLCSLSLGLLAPHLAGAGPLDLADDETEEEERDDDPFAVGELTRGATRGGDLERRGTLVIDTEDFDFEEPVELFFEGLPEDEDLPELEDEPELDDLPELDEFSEEDLLGDEDLPEAPSLHRLELAPATG